MTMEKLIDKWKEIIYNDAERFKKSSINFRRDHKKKIIKKILPVHSLSRLIMNNSRNPKGLSRSLLPVHSLGASSTTK